MLMLTKQRATVIAATLGIALSASTVPAFAHPAQSTTVKQLTTAKETKERSRPTALRTGDFVRPRSGGPLMAVESVENGQVSTSWWGGNDFRYGKFPIRMLIGPIKAPPPRD